ncbi:MAG: ribonuclease HI family protein [Chloroflexi bacterium]|nr:ribonuclease HI family protein [Chloroflexota bacterium]MBL7061960.1 ribonuclease HI family protein [Dehalococcoidia bacterium]
MQLNIYADGASWGNPGPAAIGAVIKDGKQKELASVSQYIGEATNNQAEYQAVIAALKAAARFKATEITLYLDSELVVRQLAGSYKVRNLFLFPLYKEAAELCKKFDNLSIVHIGHDANIEAHALAKAALKKFKEQRV